MSYTFRINTSSITEKPQYWHLNIQISEHCSLASKSPSHMEQHPKSPRAVCTPHRDSQHCLLLPLSCCSSRASSLLCACAAPTMPWHCWAWSAHTPALPGPPRHKRWLWDHSNPCQGLFHRFCPFRSKISQLIMNPHLASWTSFLHRRNSASDSKFFLCFPANCNTVFCRHQLVLVYLITHAFTVF